MPGSGQSSAPMPSGPRYPASTTDLRIIGLEQRVTKLEGRVQQLSLDQRGQTPGWVGPLVTGAGTTVTVSVAILGLLIAHLLSVRRQRRDEFFKRIQECQALVDRAATSAAHAWRQSGKVAHSRMMAQAFHADLAELTERVSVLTKLRPQFDVTPALLEFRRVAGLNIEEIGRRADPDRANEALGAARILSRRLIETYEFISF